MCVRRRTSPTQPPTGARSRQPPYTCSLRSTTHLAHAFVAIRTSKHVRRSDWFEIGHTSCINTCCRVPYTYETITRARHDVFTASVHIVAYTHGTNCTQPCHFEMHPLICAHRPRQLCHHTGEHSCVPYVNELIHTRARVDSETSVFMRMTPHLHSLTGSKRTCVTPPMCACGTSA
jgi:hypothetical protein